MNDVQNIFHNVNVVRTEIWIRWYDVVTCFLRSRFFSLLSLLSLGIEAEVILLVVPLYTVYTQFVWVILKLHKLLNANEFIFVYIYISRHRIKHITCNMNARHMNRLWALKGLLFAIWENKAVQFLPCVI